MLAAGPLGPALLWTAGRQGAALSCPGMAGGCDQDRSARVAPATIWRRVADDCPRHPAYLPLTLAHHATSAIQRLRAVHLAGGQWVAVDVDTASGHLVFSADVPAIAPGRSILPDDARWSPAVVTAAATGHGWYPAMIADGYQVIGENNVVARFDRATVDQMVVDLIDVHADTDPGSDAMPGEFAVLGFDGDVLVAWWETDDDAVDGLIELDRTYPDADGLFTVGLLLWPWRSAAH